MPPLPYDTTIRRVPSSVRHDPFTPDGTARLSPRTFPLARSITWVRPVASKCTSLSSRRMRRWRSFVASRRLGKGPASHTARSVARSYATTYRLPSPHAIPRILSAASSGPGSTTMRGSGSYQLRCGAPAGPAGCKGASACTTTVGAYCRRFQADATPPPKAPTASARTPSTRGGRTAEGPGRAGGGFVSSSRRRASAASTSSR